MERGLRVMPAIPGTLKSAKTGSLLITTDIYVV